MGAAKKAKGTLQGLSGVFKTLMEEHGEVTALLLRIKSSDDPKTRARLWPTLRRELLAHEKAERSVVYPTYAQYPAIAELALEHNQEANHLSTLIELINETEPSDPGWEALFKDLVKLVQHHAGQEESEIFPAGQKEFGDQTGALNDEYVRRKRAFLDQV